jgi:hypothetical protein
LAGVYAPTVVVSDSCGASVNSGFQYVVIFEASNGSVTGGGWIDSPAGAYLQNPTAVGRAQFGLVVKRKDGEPLPVGKTDFQLRAAGFDFKSLGFDSLIIIGSQAQFRGTGRVNGGGDYTFLVTATDLSIGDQFRIQIWNRATGGLVYDNVSHTAISGGNIKLHN